MVQASGALKDILDMRERLSNTPKSEWKNEFGIAKLRDPRLPTFGELFFGGGQNTGSTQLASSGKADSASFAPTVATASGGNEVDLNTIMSLVGLLGNIG